MDLEIGIQMGRDLRDRFRGCLVGAAVGDALGAPLQELNREKVKDLYGWVENYVKPGEDHPLAALEAGQYSDDTQLMIVAAEALVEGEGYNPHKLKSKLVEWYNTSDHRNPDNTTVSAVARLDAGESYKDSGVEGATGSGCIKRIIPTGLVYAGEDLIKYAYKCCNVTHKTKRASIGAIISAQCVDWLLQEETVDPPSFLDSLSRLAFRLEDGFKMPSYEFSNKLGELVELLPESYKAGMLATGNSHYVTETVCNAVFAFMHSPEEFEKTVCNAVNYGGAADTIGFLAGALSGAYNGYGRIPPQWVAGLENSGQIVQLADELYAMREK
ncbi:MAG: ADP-ribosylglycohydrolase family protein [Desulfatibacillaceae bacterium]